MANQLILSFVLQFRSDGTTSTLVFNLDRSPVSYAPPAVESVISQRFNDTASDVVDLTGDWTGASVSLASIHSGAVTLNISPVPTAGEYHTIQGRLIF